MCPSGLDSGPKWYRRSIGPKDNGPRGKFHDLTSARMPRLRQNNPGFRCKILCMGDPVKELRRNLCNANRLQCGLRV
jgi:hypothetical protein